MNLFYSHSVLVIMNLPMLGNCILDGPQGSHKHGPEWQSRQKRISETMVSRVYHRQRHPTQSFTPPRSVHKTRNKKKMFTNQPANRRSITYRNTYNTFIFSFPKLPPIIHHHAYKAPSRFTHDESCRRRAGQRLAAACGPPCRSLQRCGW